MHEVLVNRLGGLSLPRKSVVRLTDCPDMTLDVYGGRKTTTSLDLLLSDCNDVNHRATALSLVVRSCPFFNHASLLKVLHNHSPILLI